MDEIKQPEKKEKISFIVRLFKMFKAIIISDKKIGDLNGKWAAMFKLGVIGLVFCIPTGISWCIWVTNSIYSVQQHCVTMENIDLDLENLQHKILIQETYQQKILKLENKFEIVEQSVLQLDKRNSIDHTKIVITLESMKDILQFIKERQ